MRWFLDFEDMKPVDVEFLQQFQEAEEFLYIILSIDAFWN